MPCQYGGRKEFSKWMVGNNEGSNLSTPETAGPEDRPTNCHCSLLPILPAG